MVTKMVGCWNATFQMSTAGQRECELWIKSCLGFSSFKDMMMASHYHGLSILPAADLGPSGHTCGGSWRQPKTEQEGLEKVAGLFEVCKTVKDKQEQLGFGGGAAAMGKKLKKLHTHTKIKKEEEGQPYELWLLHVCFSRAQTDKRVGSLMKRIFEEWERNGIQIGWVVGWMFEWAGLERRAGYTWKPHRRIKLGKEWNMEKSAVAENVWDKLKVVIARQLKRLRKMRRGRRRGVKGRQDKREGNWLGIKNLVELNLTSSVVMIWWGLARQDVQGRHTTRSKDEDKSIQTFGCQKAKRKIGLKQSWTWFCVKSAGNAATRNVNATKVVNVYEFLLPTRDLKCRLNDGNVSQCKMKSKLLDCSRPRQPELSNRRDLFNCLLLENKMKRWTLLGGLSCLSIALMWHAFATSAIRRLPHSRLLSQRVAFFFHVFYHQLVGYPLAKWARLLCRHSWSCWKPSHTASWSKNDRKTVVNTQRQTNEISNFLCCKSYQTNNKKPVDTSSCGSTYTEWLSSNLSAVLGLISHLIDSYRSTQSCLWFVRM